MATTSLHALPGGRVRPPGSRLALTADGSDSASRPAMRVTAAVASATDPRAAGHDSGTAGPAVLAVADGAAGWDGGGLASAIAINRLVSRLPVPGDEAPGTWLRCVVADISRHLGSARLRRDRLRSMGTSFTAVALAGSGELGFTHIGNSRAYLLHRALLVQLTADQTLVRNPAGSATPHPARAPARPGLFPAVAALRGRVDDLRNLEEGVVRVGVGDRVLVCTDGVYGALSHERLTDLLLHHPSAAGAVAALMHTVMATSNRDDATAAVADVVAELGGCHDPVRRVGVAARLGTVRPESAVRRAAAGRPVPGSSV